MGHKTTATNLFLISAALIFMVFLVIVGRPALYAEATTTAMGYTDQPTPIPVDGISSDDSSKSLLKQETEHLVYSTEINRFLTVEYKPNRITNFVEPDTQIDPTSLFTFEIGSISVTNVNNPSTYPTRLMTCNSMKNPASAYCVELGYDFSIITSENGSEHNICKLPNGTFCDGWDFFAGKCGQAYSYCANQGLVTVTLENGENEFSPEYAVCADKNGNVVGRMTEMMNFYGLLRGEPELIDRFEGPPDPPMDFTDADLPPTFDWRDHLGSDWTTPVKDQQNCGSCWAFSAVGVSETAYIANNSPDLDIDLSEQYLVTDCALVKGLVQGEVKGQL